jgi:hypothetical protein
MNKMPGYARVTLDSNILWVRFENVGRKERFRILLRAFQSSFPLAAWDENMKAWQLPRAELANVVEFCDHAFGTDHIRFEQYDTIVESARQLALRF